VNQIIFTLGGINFSGNDMNVKIRPTLVVGDVVVLSKKGRKFPRAFQTKSTLVVYNVQGDGVDYNSIITCRISENGIYKYYNFYRSELWFTGKNIFNKIKSE
jgi:hypothetical protein